jgi:elongation factor P--(R)-beta-lysine ligase
MTSDEFNRLARLANNLKRRALVFDAIRAFFKERDFLEVDTPIRAPAIAPEPNIVPFESEGWFLAASPELHMKRLLAAGYPKLFQFSHCFRKGERGLWHNPEFIMLEWYRKGFGYLSIIQDMELMVQYTAEKLGMGHVIKYRGRDIDITPPWPRVTVKDAYLKAAGWDPTVDYDPARFDVDFIAKVLPSFSPTRPTVLLDYPASAASLARLKPENSNAPLANVAERAEVFIGGLELSNAYSELTNAAEQAARFKEARMEILQERGKAVPLPESFLEAVKRLPECGGIALGVDRLVMLFCDAPSIDDVMAFTTDTV